MNISPPAPPPPYHEAYLADRSWASSLRRRDYNLETTPGNSPWTG